MILISQNLRGFFDSQSLVLLNSDYFKSTKKADHILVKSLKFYRFTHLGCEDIGIRKFEFVAKAQFF